MARITADNDMGRRVWCDGCGRKQEIGAACEEIEDGEGYLRDVCPRCQAKMATGEAVGPRTPSWILGPLPG